MPNTNVGKVLETAVLYVDMRSSTELHTQTDQVTVAKILKAYMREMAQVARYFDANVRGFAGDRVMVVAEQGEGAVTSALDVAVAMRDVVRRVLNPLLLAAVARTISVGIGIDHGPMLAVKAGMQRDPQHSDLVWIGRPANIASKITDLARSDEILLSTLAFALVDFARYPPANWTYRTENVAHEQQQVYALASTFAFDEALLRAGFR